MAQFVLNTLTLSNINRFSKFFYCQNQEKIFNNIITKDPTPTQVCRYTTLWNGRPNLNCAIFWPTLYMLYAVAR